MKAIKQITYLGGVVNQMRSHLPKNIPDKCIIIGSNRSLLSGHYGEYIDNAKDAYVVRINRRPLKKWHEHYGSRTDLLIGWCPPKNLPYKTCKLEFKAYIETIRLAFNKEIQNPTTGFGAICILGHIFNEIELFGFGFTEREFKDKAFHYMCGRVFNCYHNLIVEDKWINQMQLDKPGQIYRGEEKHLDLRYPDFDPSPKN